MSEKNRIPELFGSMVFNEDTMEQYVSHNAMQTWRDCLKSGQPLPLSAANDIADAMKTWALERGCRVYDLRGVDGEPVPENPKYGLHQFKRHLGAQLVRYAGQMDWICRPVSYRMIRLAQRCLQALHRLPGQGMTAARSQLCRCLAARKSIFPMCAERKIQKN